MSASREIDERRLFMYIFLLICSDLRRFDDDSNWEFDGPEFGQDSAVNGNFSKGEEGIKNEIKHRFSNKFTILRICRFKSVYHIGRSFCRH